MAQKKTESVIVKPALKSSVKSKKVKKQRKVFIADTKHTAVVVKAAQDSTENAIRMAKALKLPITYMEEGAVIKEMPGGKKITVVKAVNTNSPKLKKGLILYAKK